MRSIVNVTHIKHSSHFTAWCTCANKRCYWLYL